MQNGVSAMSSRHLNEAFSRLSTPLLFDACVRLSLRPRTAPSGIRPLMAGSRIAGQVLPVRHYGSVDIFLEAIGTAQHGDVLVIDDNGRTDRACIGDLTALEAEACGLGGIVIWGCHRDTEELTKVGLPIFSYGPSPAGPLELDTRHPHALESARFGSFETGKQDIVFADDDGVLFVPSQDIEKLLLTALTICRTERQQAEKVKAGEKLQKQLRFDEYLAKRTVDRSYTFRKHLRAIGGAIEE